MDRTVRKYQARWALGLLAATIAVARAPTRAVDDTGKTLTGKDALGD
jgi:hypothetical protein